MKFPFQKKKKKKGKAAEIVSPENYIVPHIALVVEKNADRLSNFQPLTFLGKTLKDYAVGSNLGVQSLLKLLDPASRKNLKAGSILTIEMLYALNPDINFSLATTTDYLFEPELGFLRVNRELRTIVSKEHQLESIFTDEEAFAICGGIKKQHAWDLNQKFYLQQSVNILDVLEAHKYAMVAYSRYGEDVMNYCLSLPPLPYHNLKILKAFQLLDRLNSKNPTLALILPTNHGDKKYSISFRLKEVFNSVDSMIELKNIDTKEVIATISRVGTLTLTNKERFYKGQLLLFLNFLDDPQKQIMSFGRITGQCAICGRDLKKHESAIRGYGTVCARNLGLPI